MSTTSRQDTSNINVETQKRVAIERQAELLSRKMAANYVCSAIIATIALVVMIIIGYMNNSELLGLITVMCIILLLTVVVIWCTDYECKISNLYRERQKMYYEFLYNRMVASLEEDVREELSGNID